jgi:hypothetical protein
VLGPQHPYIEIVQENYARLQNKMRLK